MNDVTSDPRAVCVCAVMSNVYTDASHSDAFVDIIHVEDFPLIHRQLNAPNSGRTKRGARLASDEIYVETQWTLKVSMRPPASSSSSPLHMASVSLTLGAGWGCEWSRPGGPAVPGQTVHQGEWQMPEHNLGIYFSAPSCRRLNFQHFYFLRKCYTTTVLIRRKTPGTSPQVSKITGFTLWLK